MLFSTLTACYFVSFSLRGFTSGTSYYTVLDWRRKLKSKFTFPCYIWPIKYCNLDGCENSSDLAN